MIFFVKTANLTALNKAIMYVRRNEITYHLHIVHIVTSGNPKDQEKTMIATHDKMQFHPPHSPLDTVETLYNMVALFDAMYPKIKYVMRYRWIDDIYIYIYIYIVFCRCTVYSI